MTFNKQRHWFLTNLVSSKVIINVYQTNLITNARRFFTLMSIFTKYVYYDIDLSVLHIVVRLLLKTFRSKNLQSKRL